MRYLILTLFCVIGVTSALGERLLPFQGYLADRSGVAVRDGARMIQFRLFDAPVSGNVNWSGEVHRLTVNDGLVNTILGSRVSLDDVDFGRALYLEITPDSNQDEKITAADPPLLPRQVIVPVVFAVEAGVARDSRYLNGYDWSSILVDGSMNPQEGRIAAERLELGGITGELISERAIDGVHLSAGVVDGRSLELSNRVIRVKPGGIGSAELSRNSVTVEQRQAPQFFVTEEVIDGRNTEHPELWGRGTLQLPPFLNHAHHPVFLGFSASAWRSQGGGRPSDMKVKFYRDDKMIRDFSGAFRDDNQDPLALFCIDLPADDGGAQYRVEFTSNVAGNGFSRPRFYALEF